MSIEALAIVLHHSRAKGTVLTVMIGIANHAGDGGSWPTIATLAKYGRCSESRVHQAIKELVGLGELRVDRQGGGTPGYRADRRPNRYHITLTCPADCDRTANHRSAVNGVQPATPGRVHGVQETGSTGCNFDVHGVQPAAPKPSTTKPSTKNPSKNLASIAHEIVERAWKNQARGKTAQSQAKVEQTITDALTNGMAESTLEQALLALAASGEYVTAFRINGALTTSKGPGTASGKPPITIAADRKHTAAEYADKSVFA
jgi:hypothetical protein